jgi:hypothetical protein
LHLLEVGLTKCNRLLLGGNDLSQTDIDSLSELSPSALCHPNVANLLQSISPRQGFSRPLMSPAVDYATSI